MKNLLNRIPRLANSSRFWCNRYLTEASPKGPHSQDHRRTIGGCWGFLGRSEVLGRKPQKSERLKMRNPAKLHEVPKVVLVENLRRKILDYNLIYWGQDNQIKVGKLYDH